MRMVPGSWVEATMSWPTFLSLINSACVPPPIQMGIIKKVLEEDRYGRGGGGGGYG